jgi:hypothetical protein
MNEKGGMNDEEFFKYIMTSIRRLYPDMSDKPGKRVLLKMDSGPGRNYRKLILRARFIGLYIYPSVPNATSVQQETDISFGPFKNVVRKNLNQIASVCFNAGTMIELGYETFGLVVYGGICPISRIQCHDAVAEAFSVKANKKAWAQVGAVPFTKKCLENPKVRHDGTDKRDPLFDVFRDIQQQNDFAVVQLNAMGYDGDALRAQFRPDKIRERQEASASVTAPRSRERQEALSAINTAGKRFFATGGGTHQTEDDLLIGQEIGDRKKRVANLEKERKKRLDFF